MKEKAKEAREQLKDLLDEKNAWEMPQGASTPAHRLPETDSSMANHPPSPIPTPPPLPQRPHMRRKSMQERLGVESDVHDRVDLSKRVGRKNNPSGDSGVDDSFYAEPDRYENECTSLVPLSANTSYEMETNSSNYYSVAEKGKIVDITNEMESENSPPPSNSSEKETASSTASNKVDEDVASDDMVYDDCGTKEGDENVKAKSKTKSSKTHPKADLAIIRELSADVLQLEAEQDKEFVDAGKEGEVDSDKNGPLSYADIIRNDRNADKDKSKGEKEKGSGENKAKTSPIDRSLDDFVWSKAAIMDFVKDSMPRPDNSCKPYYNFSLIDKLDNQVSKDGKLDCDGCKKPIDFYSFGDTIKVLLSTSTLAGMKYRDVDRFRKHECSHFEYLTIRGGTFLDMERVARPMLKFLQGYFNLEVLIICGINELNEKDLAYHQIINRIRIFNVKMSSKLLKPKVDIGGTGDLKPGTLNIRYIGIPYPPAFTRLGNESHPIKNDLNRVDDIANINRYFRSLNRAASLIINSSRQIPTLQYLGLNGSKFTHKPTGNTHAFSSWYHKNKDYPKITLRVTREVVHLKDTVKLIAWKAIHNYFLKI